MAIPIVVIPFAARSSRGSVRFRNSDLSKNDVPPLSSDHDVHDRGHCHLQDDFILTKVTFNILVSTHPPACAVLHQHALPDRSSIPTFNTEEK